jgi:hypothetical protein
MSSLLTICSLQVPDLQTLVAIFSSFSTLPPFSRNSHIRIPSFLVFRFRIPCHMCLSSFRAVCYLERPQVDFSDHFLAIFGIFSTFPSISRNSHIRIPSFLVFGFRILCPMLVKSFRTICYIDTPCNRLFVVLF